MSANEFRGLKAVVTGGASGVGRCTAEALAAAGAAVCVLDLQPAQAPEATHGILCDVSDDAQVRAAVAEAVGLHGGLDVLVNNAGIGAQGTVADNSDEQWHRVLDINVLGIVRTTRAALPALRESRYAAIVNTQAEADVGGEGADPGRFARQHRSDGGPAGRAAAHSTRACCRGVRRAAGGRSGARLVPGR